MILLSFLLQSPADPKMYPSDSKKTYHPSSSLEPSGLNLWILPSSSGTWESAPPKLFLRNSSGDTVFLYSTSTGFKSFVYILFGNLDIIVFHPFLCSLQPCRLFILSIVLCKYLLLGK